MRRLPVLLALAALGTASCGDDDGRSAEAYCGQIARHLGNLHDPAIDEVADIAPAIVVYRRITSAAPAAIEPEWAQLLAMLETAATGDLGDPASFQRVLDTARSTRPAATRIQQYTERTCALPIDDPPPVTNPFTATTSPSVPTSSSPVTDEGGS